MGSGLRPAARTPPPVSDVRSFKAATLPLMVSVYNTTFLGSARKGTTKHVLLAFAQGPIGWRTP